MPTFLPSLRGLFRCRACGHEEMVVLTRLTTLPDGTREASPVPLCDVDVAPHLPRHGAMEIIGFKVES